MHPDGGVLCFERRAVELPAPHFASSRILTFSNQRHPAWNDAPKDTSPTLCPTYYYNQVFNSDLKRLNSVTWKLNFYMLWTVARLLAVAMLLMLCMWLQLQQEYSRKTLEQESWVVGSSCFKSVILCCSHIWRINTNSSHIICYRLSVYILSKWLWAGHGASFWCSEHLAKRKLAELQCVEISMKVIFIR